VLFALHPIQSEAVDYVWARSIVLASLFCFGALWQWLQGRPWIAVAWFAVALLAKEECAAFPLLLVWLKWCDELPEARRSKSALAAMFALALAAGARVIRATEVIPGAVAGAGAGISPGKYLLMQGAVICRYLQLVVAPYGFTVDADISVGLWVAIAAWALLIAVTVWLLRCDRTCATWWIAGLILLIPSSSIFPAADLSADRRMYLPMFAFSAAAALLLARVKAPTVLAAIAILPAGISVHRTMVWMTEESLGREAVERAPKKLRPKL